MKTELLRGHLHPIEPVEWLTPIVASKYHYRGKARLGVKLVEKKNRVLVGFREKHKPYITDIDQCPVLIKPIDSANAA